MKTYHIIYKITNNKTKRYYIGAHSTQNIEDGYMGSGVFLRRAYHKYGIENFTKEILFVFDTSQEMYEKEKELVIVSEQTYNLSPGGKGGWEYARSKVTSETHNKIRETCRSTQYALKMKPHWDESSRRTKAMREKETEEDRERKRQSLKKTMNNPAWKSTVGKKRAANISETLKRRSAEIITDDRNNKISISMSDRVCVIIEGKKRRVKKDDPILNNPNTILGWTFAS